MTWHVYEIEKPESTFAALLSFDEFKRRILHDAGTGAMELLMGELDYARCAAREAGRKGAVRGEPYMFTLPVP